ncbi:MAG: hypothetical protein ACLQBB_05905 [Solirubrobacteraceae bacterium]
MDEPTDNSPAEQPRPPGRVRLPSLRWTAALAGVMLAIGLGLGAAIGPAPETSLAGGLPGLAQRLPVLLASILARSHHAAAPAATTATTTEPPPVTPQPTPAAGATTQAAPASAPSTTTKSEEGAAETPKSANPSTKKLPAVTNVWMIALSGTSFEQALAQPAAAPYIDSQLLPAATLLSGWSALDGSAFASDAALAEPPAAGATPPQLHSIVQPPCPEGAAGAGCATETPGQLTTADDFLKATLATITATSTYKEHGLVVITFATVGIPTQSELPAGSSTAQLSYQPPAGVALLSPFVAAGKRSTVAFNPTSPRQSLEKLLH